MERLIRESRSAVELFERLATTIKEKTGGVHFLEKTPNHALRMDYITEHFPNSKIVFVVRDSRNGVRSAREHPVIWSTFPDEDRLGGYMEVWRRSVQAHLRHAKRDSALLVRYEDFCHEPQESLQGLTESIGIEAQDHQLAQRRMKKDTKRRWRLMPGSEDRLRRRASGRGDGNCTRMRSLASSELLPTGCGR